MSANATRLAGFRVNPAWRGRAGSRRSALKAPASMAIGIIALPFLLVRALSARLIRKPVDAGFGPDPLVNNVHHRRAARLAGHGAEAFCIEPYFITADFDRVFLPPGSKGTLRLARSLVARLHCFWWMCGRFRVVYVSFCGGPLGPLPLLAAVEPLLLRLAGIRTVVLPYGGDVHVPERLSNLAFRDALDFDYPGFHLRAGRNRRAVARWTRHADCVVGGADWVECMDHWDVLCLGHFTIDASSWDAPPPELPERFSADRPMRLLHAPNHRAIKGTERIVEEVRRMREDGLHVELRLVEGRPNAEVRRAIEESDVAIDQLVIGWYAMFAIESMSLRRAVICHLRPDLVAMHVAAGTAPEGGFPFVPADGGTIGGSLRWLYERPDRIRDAGVRGRAFVEERHSLDFGARMFGEIQARLGIAPSIPGAGHG